MDARFPVKFKERMQRLLDDEFPAFERTILEENNVRAFRINKRKITVDYFLTFSPYDVEKIPYNDDGFYLKDDVQMGGEVCHQAGMFYMQEPSAMIPVNSIEIKRDWRVLDLCAAPGGKTCQLSDAISDGGLLISNDIKFERCRALIDNVERLGLTNVILLSDNIDSVCSQFQAFFNMILIDATCSGEGMFRKNKNIMTYWSEKKVRSCAEIQRGILRAAQKSVCKGGYIVYSTCTYSTEENEEIVEWFLDNYPEFSLHPVTDIVQEYTSPGVMINDKYDYSLARRFYPHKGKGEGQFVAIFCKSRPEEYPVVVEGKDKTRPEDKKLVLDFISALGVFIEEERIYIKGNKVWVLPKQVLHLKKHVLRHGVFLGILQGKDIQLSHSFFMAFGNQMTNTVSFELDDYRLEQYLRGEDILYPLTDGYGAICVNGCTLGGFYARNGYLANLYPKNLTNKDIFE